ncbi:MAG: hypothetical protein ABFS35_16410 [Bacteroidota bacterium]
MMVDVIHLYKLAVIFEKSNYTPENRKIFNTLLGKVKSNAGYIIDKTLFLPNKYSSHPGIKTSNLIIFQDLIGVNSFVNNKDFEETNFPKDFHEHNTNFLLTNNQLIYAFTQQNSLKSFDIFKLKKSSANSYELFVNYTSNSMTIGSPKREDHKIAELKPTKPIRFKINGKSDFTLTGRKQRSFYEFDYVFELYNQIEKIQFLDLNKIQQIKAAPLKRCKIVNERKIFR